MMTTAALHGYLPPAATADAGLLKSLVRAVVAYQTRRADDFVGSVLAHRNPDLALELGYDVETLRKSPIKIACF